MKIPLLLLLAIPAGAERLIDIGVVPSADKIVVACEWGCVLTDLKGKKHAITARYNSEVVATENGLLIGAIETGPEARLVTPDDEHAVQINKKRYPGTVILRRAEDGKVEAVVETGIEQYLLGVVPYEMESGWPLEALKAQAVVARTFAYTQMGKYKKSGFDLTGDTRSQVYGGLGKEDPLVREAVLGTKGEVLGYKGQILNVFYHSCCGGHTADMGMVWPSNGSTPRPLKGVRDKYCEKVASSWTAYFKNSDILAAVERRTLTGGKLRAFSIGKKDIYGYVRDFVVKIGDQKTRVTANDLRQWLGPSEIRSARISRIRKSDHGIEFIGRGSGHGVGLCQWGARVQAESGRKYERILSFYFPGSTLSVIDE